MAFYGQEAVDEVLAATDIVDLIGEYLTLKQKGSNHTALCPFHNEKTPSFSVNREKQFYYCFGCSSGGDAINFLMEYDHLDFTEALETLADRAGIKLVAQKAGVKEKPKDNRSLAINLEAARYYYASFSQPMGKDALAYLVKRGVSPTIRQAFKLGYAPKDSKRLMDHLQSKDIFLKDAQKAGLIDKSQEGDDYYARFRHRLIFPIENRKGEIIAFGGRSIDGREPKYLNSPESEHFHKKSNLYGIGLAIKEMKRTSTALLMEGYMDVIMCHQYGFTNALASLGTAFTLEQAKLLSRYVEEVVLVYDQDAAGKKATVRAYQAFEGLQVTVRVALLGQEKDPDDYIKRYGQEGFSKQIKRALPFYEYYLEEGLSQIKLDDIEDKVSLTRALIPYLSAMDNSIQRAEYIKLTASKLDISPDSLHFEVEKYADECRLKKKQDDLRAQKRNDRQVKNEREKGGPAKGPGQEQASLSLGSTRRASAGGSAGQQAKKLWGDQAEIDLMKLCLRDPALFSSLQEELAGCPFEGSLSQKYIDLLTGPEALEDPAGKIASVFIKDLCQEEKNQALALMLDDRAPLNEETARAQIRALGRAHIKKKMNNLIKKIDLLEKEGKTDQVLEIEREFQALHQELNQL